MRAPIYKTSVLVFTSLFLGCLSLSNNEKHNLTLGHSLNKIELPKQKWNLVHYLNSSTEHAMKVAQHLIDRKALNTNTEAETVIIVDQLAGFEEKLKNSGFRVLYYNSVDLNDSKSELPILLIIDQDKKVQYVGPYFQKDCQNCKANDLIPLMKSKLKKKYGNDENNLENAVVVKNLIEPLQL